jgi:hypothetical protein
VLEQAKQIRGLGDTNFAQAHGYQEANKKSLNNDS